MGTTQIIGVAVMAVGGLAFAWQNRGTIAARLPRRLAKPAESKHELTARVAAYAALRDSLADQASKDALDAVWPTILADYKTKAGAA